MAGDPLELPNGRRVPRLPTGPVTAVASGGALGVMLGGTIGFVLGLVVGVVVHRGLRTLESGESRRVRERRMAALPGVLDLLAVCLRAGMPLGGAVDLVAGAAPGPLSDDLRSAAAMQQLGASLEASWADLRGDPALGPVARAVVRSSESGSRLAAAFEGLAADQRNAATLAGEARARRAGVLAMAPLSLCFLPAFVTLGVAPVVLSIAASVLGEQGLP